MIENLVASGVIYGVSWAARAVAFRARTEQINGQFTEVRDIMELRQHHRENFRDWNVIAPLVVSVFSGILIGVDMGQMTHGGDQVVLFGLMALHYMEAWQGHRDYRELYG